jgi:hypothetical protein
MLQCRQHADGMQARGRLLDFARHEPAATARPMRDLAAERACGGANAQGRNSAPPCLLRR